MRRRRLLWIIGLGLILRIAFALAIYEPSLLSYHYGDFTEYQNAARLILHGDLTFSDPVFLIRPPLFPVLMSLLGMQPIAILAVNIVLATCVIPLTYALARQFKLSRNLALLAAAVVAIDPTSVKYSGVLLAASSSFPRGRDQLLICFGFPWRYGS